MARVLRSITEAIPPLGTDLTVGSRECGWRGGPSTWRSRECKLRASARGSRVAPGALQGGVSPHPGRPTTGCRGPAPAARYPAPASAPPAEASHPPSTPSTPASTSRSPGRQPSSAAGSVPARRRRPRRPAPPTPPPARPAAQGQLTERHPARPGAGGHSAGRRPRPSSKPDRPQPGAATSTPTHRRGQPDVATTRRPPRHREQGDRGQLRAQHSARDADGHRTTRGL